MEGAIVGVRNRKNKRKQQEIDLLDPLVLKLQDDIFKLRTAGMSVTAIAAAMGLPKGIVLDHLHIETQRRADELKGARMSQTALAVSRYEAVMQRAYNRITKMREAEAEGKKGASRFAFLEEKIIIDSQKRIDKLLGLEAPRVIHNVDDEGKTVKPSVNVTLVTPIMQLAALPPDERVRVLERARELKEMKNVTPIPVTIEQPA